MLHYHFLAGSELLPLERTMDYITTFDFNFGPPLALQYMDVGRFMIVCIEEELESIHN